MTIQEIEPMTQPAALAALSAAVADLSEPGEARDAPAIWRALAARVDAARTDPATVAAQTAAEERIARERAVVLAAEVSARPGALDDMAAVAAAMIERHEGSAASAIDRAWDTPPIDLTMPPPVREWLLRHPTQDDRECAPGRGDGMFARGRVGLMVADGGVGKTQALVSLAVAIATGRPWLGHFHVDPRAVGGRVLLALGEEDRDEVHRRMYAAATAMHLSAEERSRCAARIQALPLAGALVSISAKGPDGRVIASPDLAALRRRLDASPEPWSLLVIDPFARFAASGDEEKDNAAATAAVTLIESLCSAPGHPSVLVAHHASAEGVKSGVLRPRGVTGIPAAVRWVATLRAEERGEDVFFRQIKSNYSRPMPDEIRLVRFASGALRAASAEERAMRVDAAEEARRSAAEQKVRERKAVADKVAAEADETMARKLAGAATAAPVSARDLECAAGLTHGAPATRALTLAAARGWIRAEGTGHRGAPTWVRGVTP